MIHMLPCLRSLLISWNYADKTLFVVLGNTGNDGRDRGSRCNGDGDGNRNCGGGGGVPPVKIDGKKITSLQSVFPSIPPFFTSSLLYMLNLLHPHSFAQNLTLLHPRLLTSSLPPLFYIFSPSLPYSSISFLFLYPQSFTSSPLYLFTFS